MMDKETEVPKDNYKIVYWIIFLVGRFEKREKS